MCRSLSLSLLMLMTSVVWTVSAQAVVDFHVLGNAEGLSNSSVTCMVQDPNRIMWVGTWDGLNSYNGYNFNCYKYDASDCNTISNNVIRDIVVENEHIIWVATAYGINRISVSDGRIDRFYPGYEDCYPPDSDCFFVEVLDGGIVFCASTGWGLSYYDSESGRLHAINVSDFNTSSISALYSCGASNLVVKDDSGTVYFFKCKMSDGKPIVKSIVKITDGVKSVFEDNDNLFIITQDQAVYRLSKDSASLSRLFSIGPNQDIVAITSMEEGIYAVAFSNAEVHIYDSVSGNFCMEEELLSGINVLSMYYGDQDILWIGSDGMGLLKLYKAGLSFDKVTNRMLFNSKSSPVRAFYEDDSDNFYVATKGNGIVRLDKGNMHNRKYIDVSAGLANNSVYALSEGLGDGQIAAGSDGDGIDVILENTLQVFHIPPQDGNYYRSVYSIYKDEEQGCLWLGTNGYGLVKLSYEIVGSSVKVNSQEMFLNSKDSHSISNNSVVAIVPAGEDCLWLGTRGGGLCLFDKNTHNFRIYSKSPYNVNTLSDNDVLCLYLSCDSTLWIGTSYGLNSLAKGDEGAKVFHSFMHSDGLENNTIHGILEDACGSLWLSTTKGISKFDTSNGQFTNYFDYDQLQNNEFADGAFYRAKDGTLYFGGINGYNSFVPENLSLRDFKPKVLFDEFIVKQHPLSCFNPSHGLVLKHDENFFTVRFHALDYIHGGNCEYSYMLKGFDSYWSRPGTDHSAVYTNVPPGRYEFVVKCTNGDKVWSDDVASFTIIVKTSLWNRWWAYLIYFFMGMSLVVIFLRIYRNWLKQKNELMMESLRRQHQKDEYEAKLTFFTNISHEFCTPLTLIYGSAETLLDAHNLPDNVVKHIRSIRNNSVRMQSLIGELIDFRKVNTGHYNPVYNEVDICDMLSSIVDNFREAFEINNIDMVLDLPETFNVIISDKGAIEKILYNLVSNAFKYTPAYGRIVITLSRSGKDTVVKVSNTGRGISPEDLGRVFNRFDVLDSLEKNLKKGNVVRNGIGMSLAKNLAQALSGDITVESEINKCTTFTLFLPYLDRDNVELSEFDGVASEDAAVFNEDRQEIKPIKRHDGKLTILVVDDEKPIRDLIDEILTKEGFDVVQAEDGGHAIDVMSDLKPDMIISDMIMPKMNGMSLLKYIRSNELTKNIPFVFLSFKAGIVDKIESNDAGSDAYIEKPFHPQYLVAVVKRIVNNRANLKAYYNSVTSNMDVHLGNVMDMNDKKFLIKLTSLVEENITDENLSLDFLCEKMFLSRTQLYRKIKNLSGKSPSEFICSVKIKHAEHLILSTNMRIQEIMYASGFNNKSYFYREFEKRYQMSPKMMRENQNINK